jgi:hypothetical protein
MYHSLIFLREKLPNDYVKYPGKMDHATVVTIKIGDFQKALRDAAKNL